MADGDDDKNVLDAGMTHTVFFEYALNVLIAWRSMFRHWRNIGQVRTMKAGSNGADTLFKAATSTNEHYDVGRLQ